MGRKKPTLEAVEDVIKYIGNDDVLIVRNISGKEEKHWIENWDRGQPEKIKITEDLYFDLFDHEDFDFARDFKNEEDEFYLRYYPGCEIEE